MISALKLLPWRIVAVLCLTIGGTLAGYFHGVSHTTAQIEADIAREERIAQRVYESALAATAARIAEIEVKHTTIRQELEREVRVEQVYMECRHSDDAYRMLNAALTGAAPAESVDRSELSGADAAD